MRSLVAAAALVLIPGVATADGNYFSMGMGPTSVEDDLATQTGSDGARMRMAIGHRVGRLAFEAFVAPEFFDDSLIEGVGVGVDARYILPVSNGLQLYVRGSASHLSTTLSEGGYTYDDSPQGDGYRSVRREYAGRGLGGGVGVQFRGSVRALGFLYAPMFFLPVGPKVNAAIFIDHGYDYYRLHPTAGSGQSMDARVSRLTIGINVGSDF